MVDTGIGKRVARKEDARLVTGRGTYVADLKMSGLREVAFLRSPLAHARLTSISKPNAAADRVFVAEDLVGVLPITARSTLPSYRQSDYPVLATGKVRFAGEPIAMAVAESRAEAEDLCEAIELDLTEIAPIADVWQALVPDAGKVHDDWPDNLFLRTEIEQDLSELETSAAVKIEREIGTARQCMMPMEGKGVLAYWDDRTDQLVVVSSTQVPHIIRTGLSECLGLEHGAIRVQTVDIGGGFGYKATLQPEEVCLAWLALTYRAPFRWIEDRREHLTAGANTREHHYKIKAYADERGRLLGLDAEIWVDVGAYSVYPFTACIEAAQAGGNLPGPYKFDFYRCKTYSVATNKPPFAPYRGVARPGVCFAIEQIIDAIAREVGREAADVREENLVPGQAMPFTNITGKHYDSGDYPASLRGVRQQIGLDQVRRRQQAGEADGRLLGVGFATYTEQSAHGTAVFASWGIPIVPGYEQATVRLMADGGVEVRAGIQSIGQGLETTLAQVASEILTIPTDHIQVLLGDTAMTPYSTGAYASRGMVMAGGAVSKSAGVLADRIKLIAAHLLQCEAAEIVFVDGEIRGGGASLKFSDVGRAWYLRPEELPEQVDQGGLEVTQGYKPGTDLGVFSYASHAAVVAVDPATGLVEILDYAITEDCGRMVNPMVVEGQAYGGTAQGIGTALFEESSYDAFGQPLSSTLADYVLPGPAELPSIKIQHMETLSPHTAHGIKGVGEGSAIAPPAAIVNAVNDALTGLGVEINRAPMSPSHILGRILARTTPAATPGTPR